ncbi:MAG: hypothetical protein H0W83_13930, partial [Planctomycetes bacterium]|nr:hypothetical protein [Planctomycetota bacterium]
MPDGPDEALDVGVEVRRMRRQDLRLHRQAHVRYGHGEHRVQARSEIATTTACPRVTRYLPVTRPRCESASMTAPSHQQVLKTAPRGAAMPPTTTLPCHYRFLHVLLVAGLFVSTAAAMEPAAKPEAANQLTLATERVVIFKDGYALFVKTATGVSDGEGRVFTDQVPDGAVLGCFWATSDQQKAVGMTAEWMENTQIKTATTACITTVELLRANRGRKVALVLTGDKAPTVNGTIVDVLDLPAEPLPPELRPGEVGSEDWNRLNSRAEPAVRGPRELIPRGGQLVAMDTEQGRLVLPVAQVVTVAGAELVTTMERRTQQTVWSKRLGFDLGKEAANRKSTLRILYFAEGLRWIPTYRIGGSLEDKADIALQGEVINEAEDIADAAVDLVVGVPNFRFKTSVSPLSLESTLRHSLATAAPSLMNQQYNVSTFGNRVGAGSGQA